MPSTKQTPWPLCAAISWQVGTIFNLVDSLACGTVGVLVTARSRQATLEKAQDALKFIRRIVS